MIWQNTTATSVIWFALSSGNHTNSSPSVTTALLAAIRLSESALSRARNLSIDTI
jgi:hypothetical protein